MNFNKKQIIKITATALAAIIIIVIIGLINANIDKTKPNSNITVNIYFLDNNQNSSLKPEQRTIKNGANKEIIGNVLNELIAGPKNTSFKPTFPQSVKIIEAQLERSIVTVNLSREYKQLKNKEELYLRTSIIKTLTDLSFIEAVSLTVEGEEITPGPIKGEDIIIDEVIPPSPTSDKIIKLYFTNTDASGLIPEERQIQVHANQPLERYIMEQLILGPTDTTKYTATVPPETKILGEIETIDGVCYVDLSMEFVTKHNGGSMAEIYTIYSIVNSLTELSHIKKVQFLIKGEKLSEYKGHIDFSTPFERDEETIVNYP